MDFKKIKKTIISKQLVIFFYFFIVDTCEIYFYPQCKNLWIKTCKKVDFKNFLLNQLFKKDRFKIITVKLNFILNIFIENNVFLDLFIKYCENNNYFSNFIINDKNIIDLQLKKEIIFLIIVFNLLFFQLINFSLTKIKFIKKRKYLSFNILLDYIQNNILSHNLLKDLKDLKKNIKFKKYLKFLNLDFQFLLQILKICNKNSIFIKTTKKNNKLIC